MSSVHNFKWWKVISKQRFSPSGHNLSYNIIWSSPPSPALCQFTHGVLRCARSHTRWEWAECCCGQTDTRVCPLCCCSPAQTETVRQRLMGWYILIHWHSVASKRIFLHYITNPCVLTHSAVCIRVTGGKIRHGVQRQETRRTPAQVQTRITVILTHTNTRNTLKCKLWGLLWCSIHTFTLKHFCSTHREAKFLKLFSAEGTSSFVTQTALAFHLKRGLPEPVKHVPLLLKGSREMHA